MNIHQRLNYRDCMSCVCSFVLLVCIVICDDVPNRARAHNVLSKILEEYVFHVNFSHLSPEIMIRLSEAAEYFQLDLSYLRKECKIIEVASMHPRVECECADEGYNELKSEFHETQRFNV